MAYFWRAFRNLKIAKTERKAEYLFYAALEFRNCIERLLFEYLYLTGHENWSPKWDKVYRPTRLKDEILRIEPEFIEKLEFVNLYMKSIGCPNIHIIDLELFNQLYGRLGNYLHASKSPVETSESFLHYLLQSSI